MTEVHGSDWWNQREKDGSNYDSFRTNLDYYLGDKDISSKQYLKELMYNTGFRFKKIKGQKVRVYPKDEQINFAWDYLTVQSAKQLELGITEKKRFFISPDKHYRISYSFTYNNKQYKRGQFAPKGVYENE